MGGKEEEEIFLTVKPCKKEEKVRQHKLPKHSQTGIDRLRAKGGGERRRGEGSIPSSREEEEGKPPFLCPSNSERGKEGKKRRIAEKGKGGENI